MTNEEIFKLIIQVLSILLGSGVTSAIVAAIIQRRKNTAEAKKTEGELADLLTSTAYKTVDRINQDLAELRKENKTLTDKVNLLGRHLASLRNTIIHYELRIEYLMAGIERLTAQLLSNQIIPAWKPEEWHINSEFMGTPPLGDITHSEPPEDPNTEH